jgi:hypothetical protein
MQASQTSLRQQRGANVERDGVHGIFAHAFCFGHAEVAEDIVPNKPTANAQAGANIYNATEHNVGNYYGSRATIQRTDPILRGGHWVYHRTMALHNNAPNACFKFSEIGWWKKTTVNFEGYLAYKNGCGNSGYGWLSFSISPGTHTYSQQYLESWGLPDRYGFHIDGAWLGSGVTNFSYTTSVGCGGEVWGGMEAMGNTYCGSNLKGMNSAPNVYYFTPWGSILKQSA